MKDAPSLLVGGTHAHPKMGLCSIEKVHTIVDIMRGPGMITGNLPSLWSAVATLGWLLYVHLAPWLRLAYAHMR